MATFTWDGRTVEIRSRLTGRYLFLATEEELIIDGRAVLRSGGFSVRTRKHAAVEHQGMHVKVTLDAKVSIKAPLGAWYRFLVDDAVAWEGPVTPGLAWKL